MQFTKSDTIAMEQALALAGTAKQTGDVPVAALVLNKAGAVIGSGVNTREGANDPAGHAEINALCSAASVSGNWRLDDMTLVVTLEPCVMCAGALVQARVSRLVFAAFDDKAGAVGSVWDLVRDRRLNHQPEVVSGLMADESSAMLKEFFAAQRN